MSENGSEATTTAQAELARAIIRILESTNSPAIQQAREVIAQRLAISGDVAPSRIPAPANHSLFWGYVNWAQETGALEQRDRMVAAALGIAGPQLNVLPAGMPPPLAFVNRAQPRPAGPQQASFPLTLSLRSDFVPAFEAVLAELAAMGAAAPIVSPVRHLPPPGAAVAPGREQLDIIGRHLRLAPTAALRDPLVDPLSLTRPTAGGPFEVTARIADPAAPQAGTITAAEWTSWGCTAQACIEVDTTDARLPLAPLLNAAGWHQSAPLASPINLSEPGDWASWSNITGLLPGETRFGDELALVYSAMAILNSGLADQLDLVWDGEAFSSS